MNTIKKTTKNIAKSNRTIANRFESDEQDLFLDKKGSTVMKDIAKTNNYIAKRLSIVTDDSDILNTSTPPTDENSFVTAGNIRDIYNVPYGIVGLNGSGLIDAEQLPSYVDDVIEGYYYNGAFYSDSSHQYEIVPETGKIYVDITDPDHAQSYRWSGSAYSIIADPKEALFDVNFTEPVPGNLNSDKTLAEIEEAVSDGKVVRGFFGNITYYLTSIQHDTNVKFNAAIKNINYNIEGKNLNNVWNWSYNSWDLSNIKPDWNATAGADNEILNKPSIPDTLDDLAVDATFTINGVTQTVTCDKTFSEMGNTPYIAIVLNYAGGVTYNLKCIASKSSDLINTITTPMLQSQGGTYEFNFLYSNNNWSVTFIAPSDFQLQSDWNQTNTNAKDYIKNKPTIPAAQIQADWEQSDNSALDFIKNKPNLPTVSSFDDIFYVETLYDNSTLNIQNMRTDDITIKYSLDKITWTEITINSNTSYQHVFDKCKIYFKSDLGYLANSSSNRINFSVDKDFAVGGKLVYLINSNGIEPDIIPNYCFRLALSSSHLVDAKKLILLEKTSTNCYHTMFQSSKLEETPILRAEYPVLNAYYGMFAHTQNTLKRVISKAKVWTEQDMYIGDSWYAGGEFINLGRATNIIRSRAGAPTNWNIKTPAFENVHELSALTDLDTLITNTSLIKDHTYYITGGTDVYLATSNATCIKLSGSVYPVI